MAFAYTDQSASDDPLKQNIFGQQAQQQQGGQQQGDNLQKASIEGSSVDAGGGQSQVSGQPSQAQAQPKVQQSYNPKNVQSAYGNIARRLSLPEQRLQNARSSITDANQKLQDEANRYAQSAQTAVQNYKIDDDTLKKSVAGDAEAWKKTSGLLQQQAAPEFEAFKGIADIPNVDYLKNTQDIYSQGAGPNYSSGQRRMDAALLRMNPEYNKGVEQIFADQAELQKRNDEMMDAQTRDRRAEVSKGYGDALSDVRRRLGLMGEDVVSKAKAKELEEDKRRQGLNQADITRAELQKVKDQLRQDLGAQDPSSRQYRAKSWIDMLNDDQLTNDLGKYTNVNRDTDWHNFLSKDDVDQYNRVQSLLGNGETLSSQGPAAGDYNFDRAGAYNDILQRLLGNVDAATLPLQNTEAVADQPLARDVKAAVESGAIQFPTSGDIDFSGIGTTGSATRMQQPVYDPLANDVKTAVQSGAIQMPTLGNLDLGGIRTSNPLPSPPEPTPVKKSSSSGSSRPSGGSSSSKSTGSSKSKNRQTM